MVTNELCALGMMAELNQRQMCIPSDISVIAMASAEMAAVSNPPMTIMRAPGRQLGELGLEALVRQIEGGVPLPPELVACPLELGQSTGPARSGTR